MPVLCCCHCGCAVPSCIACTLRPQSHFDCSCAVSATTNYYDTNNHYCCSYHNLLTHRYDRDSSGAMDAVEVGSLLEDLGVTPTEERLHAAFAEFDSNGDGLVTLEEASHSFL
jgi:hypothetical protein